MIEPADVLIIGAGASGGVAARRLAERGLHVVCLEQGGWPDRDAYPGTSPDWELVARKHWSSSPNLRGLPADYPIDLADSEMVLGNFNGVGGGTILYAAVWPRLLPSDFRTSSDLGIADDWPLSYEELLPYYEETDRQFGVSGLGGNPAYPPGADPPLPPLPIGRAGLALGPRARAARLALVARIQRHPVGRTRRPARLRATRDVRYRLQRRGQGLHRCHPLAPSRGRGARLVTSARVRRIVVDPRGRACGAEWIDAAGAEHYQPADVVLCAANGMGTARLLLLSATNAAPDGLANSSGLVGRRLMVHPGALVTGYFADDLESWRGQIGGQIQSLEFGGTDPERGFLGGAKWILTPTGGPLGVAFGPRGKPVLGDEHHRHMHDRFGRGARWVILCEDLPDPDNRIELSPTLKDPSGIPAPRVVYHLSDDAHRAAAWNTERAIESLTEAGAVFTEAIPMRNNSHLLGTARMGDDRSSSVVDRWGMAHDVPNLGVIDGSVFVTVGAANPTSTIAALALRAVDHLVETRRRDRPSRASAELLGARRRHRDAVGHRRTRAARSTGTRATPHAGAGAHPCGRRDAGRRRGRRGRRPHRPRARRPPRPGR